MGARLPRDAAEFPVYSRAERRADAAVHVVGLALGLAGCVGLAAAALSRSDAGPRLFAGFGLHAAGWWRCSPDTPNVRGDMAGTERL